jgi:hypothetical protein
VTSISQAEKEKIYLQFREYTEEVAQLLERHTLSRRGNLGFSALLAFLDRAETRQSKALQSWTEDNVEPLYRATIREVDRELKKQGVTTRANRAWEDVHRERIRLLLEEPGFGVGPRLETALGNLNSNVRSYAKAHRRLMGELKLLREHIAFGVVSGAEAKEVVDSILLAFEGRQNSTVLELQRFQAGGRGGVLRTLADAPYLKIPLRSGGFRRVHINDYIRTVVVTMESQIRRDATVTRLQQRGIELARVSPNPPLTPDVCSIYAGRVFSLTPEAESLTGYPQLSRTPNGGPPFHPNCVTSDVRIQTMHGYRLAPMIEKGMKILSASGRYRKVNRVWQRRYAGPVVRVETETGAMVCLTPNHRLVAVSGDESPHWRLNAEATKRESGGISAGDLVQKMLIGESVYIKSHVSFPGKVAHHKLHSPFVDRVVHASVEDYDGEVYNFEVARDHTYFAGRVSVYNCTHSLLPFVIRVASPVTIQSSKATGTPRVPNEQGVPKAALDTTWEQAQSWLKSKGGIEFAVKQNPQLKRFAVPARSSDAVKEALK